MQQIDAKQLHRFGFLTLPNYSMIAFSGALEACRMANYVAGRDIYSWKVLTLDGAPAIASNGLAATPTEPIGEAADLDVLFVCGGVRIREATSRATLEVLRGLARQKLALGALCTGTFTMARAGLLDGYRCAIHWENLGAIREEFPKVTFTGDLFVVDRDRLTASGGTAPLDLMLNLIRAGHGDAFAATVSNQFVVERIRGTHDPQVVPLKTRLGAGHPLLVAAASVMENHVEHPLALETVARQAGLSLRQLERLFRQWLGIGPSRYYMNHRLDRARALLVQTDMPVTEVALATGFRSAAHFATRFRKRFGLPPQAERHETSLNAR